MPRRATALRAPAPPEPKARTTPKKKAAPKKKKAAPRSALLTPSERHKVMMAGLLLMVFLLAVLIHSGECIRTSDGCRMHFHDLRGAVLLSLDLSLSRAPRISW